MPRHRVARNYQADDVSHTRIFFCALSNIDNMCVISANPVQGIVPRILSHDSDPVDLCKRIRAAGHGGASIMAERFRRNVINMQSFANDLDAEYIRGARS